MEGRQPLAPSLEEEQPRAAVAAERVVPSYRARPPRRRRSALLGGGVLVAASPVAVGAGLFVLGFAALGLGACLFLLPPPKRSRERRHRSPSRVVRRAAVVGGRGVVGIARGSAWVGARTITGVERFAVTTGRDGAVRAGRASVAGAAGAGRVAHGAGSRGWSALLFVAPSVWRGLVVAARWLLREARSGSIRVWERTRPMLRRGWAAFRAASARAAHDLASLVRLVRARLSAYIDSRTGPEQPRSRLPRAPRSPPRRYVVTNAARGHLERRKRRGSNPRPPA